MLDFLRWDAEVAKAGEPGTLRFDVWEFADEPDAVYLYEAYVDQAALDAHREGEPVKPRRFRTGARGSATSRGVVPCWMGSVVDEVAGCCCR